MNQDFLDLLRAFADHSVRYLIVGAPLSEVSADDFSRPGIVFQMGLPPVRVDVLTELTGLTFAEAWPGRMHAPFGPLAVDVIGREAFIQNKRATGRAKDLGDIERLGDPSK
ncbi:MAG: hypothetical protein ABI051_04115 [Vicinamibacterales bacterium]